MATKAEIIDQLVAAGIDHDASASKAELEALLPEGGDSHAPTEREVRWAAFLANAEKQNPTKFAEKKAKGIFDSIPDSFV